MKTLTEITAFLGLATLTVLELSAPLRAHAQYQETVLARFNVTNGQYPQAPLVRDSQGNLYGTTFQGGTAGGFGTVFEWSAATGVRTLASFGSSAGQISSGLVLDAQGNLFGAAGSTLFEIPQGGSVKTIAQLSGSPFGDIIADAQGNLYGTTVFGGTNRMGSIFELPVGGTARDLYSFPSAYSDNTAPREPYGGLVRDAQGNLFGTTELGGANGGGGSIFEMTSSGTMTTLASFDGSHGDQPRGDLTLDAQGNLYGLAQIIYELPVGGTLQTAATFRLPGGISPTGSLLMDSRGNFYGTTIGGGAGSVGTVFQYTPNVGLTTLYSFTDANGDGAAPSAGLIMDSSGNFYGTTQGGGSHEDGTIFELSPTPEPSALAVLSLGLLGLAALAIKARKRSADIS